MAERKLRLLTAALLVAACSTAYGVSDERLPDAANELLRMYPGAQVHKEQDRVRIIYGVPMTPGLSARDASSSFITTHGSAFGAGTLELREDWSADFGDGSRTVFCYQQYIGGVPVEYGMLKVLVQNGPVPRVTFANAILAPAPEGGFPAPVIDGRTAVNSVRGAEALKRVTQWSEPSLVVYQGVGDWVAPSLAWKFSGEMADPSAAFHKTWFVDAATGKVLKVRDDVSHSDVTGTIMGKGSPGLSPDAAYNPPALLAIPSMRAAITGGNNAYTNNAGEFSIVNPGTSPVTVSCGVNGSGAGRWVNVVPTGTGAITASLNNITPPGPANLVLNPSPSEQLTAQVNGFICTTATHDYVKDRLPTFTRLDIAIPCNTGVAGTCNAFYQNSTINFYNSGGGCPNTCYTTVVSHEYGHFIVSKLGPSGGGLAQGGFGEGYGDTTAELLWNDKSLARGWNGQNTYLRDPIDSNIQYPCAQEIHTCGMVLSGVWWRTLTFMKAFYGEQPGLDQTRQLELNWSLITAGGPNGNDAAGPTTAIEVLTADDNDGNINNGTPNFSRICPAFAAHSITCPALHLLTFQYPNGRPTTITPNQPFDIPVNVVADAATPLAGSGTMTYKIDNGSFTTVPMNQTSPNQYIATLPATACGHSVSYYFSAQTTTGYTATDPVNAPSNIFSTVAGTIQTVPLVTTDFNGALPAGWAASGLWHISSGCAPTGTPCAGSQWAYYGQDATCTFDTGARTTGALTMPAISLPPPVPNGQITLNFCYALTTENANSYDKATVTVNGTQVDRVPDAAGWTSRQVNLTSYAGQNVTIAFAFDSVDQVNNAYKGWQLDNVVLTASTVPCNACYANCDGSTNPPVLNVNDFTCFLNQFAAGDSRANCDGSTVPPVLNVNDFTCFINRFAQGCP